MGKRGPKPNLFRTTQIIEVRLRNPCATLQQIGDKFGITRERIRQVLKEYNMPTRCLYQKKQYKCLNCDKLIEGRGTHFCSFACWKAYHNITVICNECGESFTILQSQLIPKRTQKRKLDERFCSKQCYGKWLGHHYGFGQSPEHIRGNIIKGGNDDRE